MDLTRYKRGQRVPCPTCGRKVVEVLETYLAPTTAQPCGCTITVLVTPDDPGVIHVGPGVDLTIR